MLAIVLRHTDKTAPMATVAEGMRMVAMGAFLLARSGFGAGGPSGQTRVDYFGLFVVFHVA